MSPELRGSLSAQSDGPASSRRRVTRWVPLVALGVSLGILILAVTVGPGWFSEQPRPARRQMVDLFLRCVLITYTALAIALPVAAPLLLFLLVRARARGTSGPRLERACLLCVSCLLALVPLELGAASWRAWTHRFPRLPTNFEPSALGEYRILVLGGSSALGEPYRPWLSVGQIVAWQLQQAVPERQFVCEILAWLGETLEAQHQKLARITRRPDVVIIYAGHNEFAGRFGEEHESSWEEAAQIRLLHAVQRARLSSPFCRLVSEIKSRNGLDTPPLSGRHFIIDPPLCTPAESAEILADFSARLEAILSYCERIGALAILIIPPANESGFEPSRSTVSPAVSRSERKRLAGELHQARAEESTDPGASAARYSAILGRQPDFAEAHFRLARLLEGNGQTTEAAHHYLAALDHDGLPIRCQEELRDAIKQAANRHPKAILIDGRRELSSASRSGLIGDDMISDAHHPTLSGYVVLGTAVLRELQLRQLFVPRRPIELPLDPAACAGHFAMDADKWATVCMRNAEHYRRVAGYRYDPAERLEKARRHAEGARQIREGTRPEELGIPGIGAKQTPRGRRR
jgi:hypothetical protein